MSDQEKKPTPEEQAAMKRFEERMNSSGTRVGNPLPPAEPSPPPPEEKPKE